MADLKGHATGNSFRELRGHRCGIDSLGRCIGPDDISIVGEINILIKLIGKLRTTTQSKIIRCATQNCDQWWAYQK